MKLERGWITMKTVFLVGAIILGSALLVGGLYYVKERGETTRRETAIATAEEELKEQTSGSSSSDAADSDTDDADSSSTSDSTSDSATDSVSSDATDSTDTSPSDASDTTASDSTASDTTVSELPATGAGDFLQLLGLAGVVLAGGSYAVSRRQLV